MTNAAALPRAFLHPRYWATWLGIGLLRLVTYLPLAFNRRVGAALGALLGRLMSSRRRVVRVNLRLCFPQLSDAERERLLRAHFRAVGAGVFEAAFAWFASDARVRRCAEIRGLEHLDAVLDAGQGALLLTGHFTTLELGARILATARPFHAMYRPINNRLIDHYMRRWRGERSGLPALPKDDLKKLVKALRAGRPIWYAPDQTLGRQTGVFLPMFGVPTFTITATSRLAEMGRARVVPFFTRKEKGRYIVECLPALEGFPSGDDVADTLRIHQLIETAVQQALPDYFWLHRRFKQRPPGMPDPYA
jgi:KDO2-lipid IV(A) lauroyltransferase